ncbi:hypothetical protein BZL29_6594 [Mycobacterium kansasii]|uniref:Uncharacterized protein n=1 Tax=Mycobacterium kansasii TaxID=1768 RepID=A0A1V3WNA3_MYCKA|nr:hypothetical protein BZL29_6594 [Mycobacterium kansasii]
MDRRTVAGARRDGDADGFAGCCRSDGDSSSSYPPGSARADCKE